MFPGEHMVVFLSEIEYRFHPEVEPGRVFPLQVRDGYNNGQLLVHG